MLIIIAKLVAVVLGVFVIAGFVLLIADAIADEVESYGG
jgi:hypothetical protein